MNQEEISPGCFAVYSWQAKNPDQQEILDRLQSVIRELEGTRIMDVPSRISYGVMNSRGIPPVIVKTEEFGKRRFFVSQIVIEIEPNSEEVENERF